MAIGTIKTVKETRKISYNLTKGNITPKDIEYIAFASETTRERGTGYIVERDQFELEVYNAVQRLFTAWVEPRREAMNKAGLSDDEIDAKVEALSWAAAEASLSTSVQSDIQVAKIEENIEEPPEDYKTTTATKAAGALF